MKWNCHNWGNKMQVELALRGNFYFGQFAFKSFRRNKQQKCKLKLRRHLRKINSDNLRKTLGKAKRKKRNFVAGKKRKKENAGLFVFYNCLVSFKCLQWCKSNQMILSEKNEQKKTEFISRNVWFKTISHSRLSNSEEQDLMLINSQNSLKTVKSAKIRWKFEKFKN